MAEPIEGQAVLMTGPQTPLTLAVARRLGLEGMRLAFAGSFVRQNTALDMLERQFRGQVVFLPADLADPQGAQEVADATERVFGRLDLWIHTLGPSGGSGLVPIDRPSHALAPLTAALTCSSGAMRYMARRRHGHIVHLVTRAEVGAVEVERLALTRLQQAWAQSGAPPGVALSAIYFEEEISLPLETVTLGETRLLERFAASLLEEDDRAARLMLERDIGDLVMRVCAQGQALSPGRVQSFDFPDNTTTRTLH